MSTWRAAAQAVTYAANKDMIDVFNASASTRVIRVYRMWLFNNQTTAITGVLNTLRIHVITGATGGTAITPTTHDTANPALNANTTSGHNRTLTLGAIMRQILHSPDEPSVSTLDWDAIGTLVPFSQFWEAGYFSTAIQPFTMRPGENRGLSIVSITQTVGNADVEAEFTDAAS